MNDVQATFSAAAKQSKYRSIDEILSMPSMAARLSSFVDEAVKSKQNIQFERETLKALGANATEELGIKPEVFRSYVDMVFKNDYAQRLDKYDELYSLVNSVMKMADIQLPAPTDD